MQQHTYTHPFNGPLSRTTWVSQYQKGKTSLDFTEVRDSEWQWHQLGHMQVCTSLQTDNHASNPPLRTNSGVTNKEKGSSCPRVQQVRGTKLIFMTSEHKSEYDKVCCMSQK